MKDKTLLHSMLLAALVSHAWCAQAAAVPISAKDIGGVVRGDKGPEAGVWVIAETTDLPTRYAKVVVTDDQGRFVIPELPKANYRIWVRGYGLVDSAKVQSRPGKTLELRAVTAGSEKDAAEYYPGMYWYSLLGVPAKADFVAGAPNNQGMAPGMMSQEAWQKSRKDGRR